MRTDDLIRAIAADRMRAAAIGPTVGAALAGGLAVALALFLAGLGVRSDIAEAAVSLRFLLKPAEMILLAAGAVLVLARLARPDGTGDLRLLVPGLALLAAAVAGELLTAPVGEWEARLLGDNALVCLAAIPTMAAAPLAGLVLALRRAAPARPAGLGAAAGLLAGALAGALYAIHCPDDSPLFVAVWYGVALAATTATGAVAGRRWLRW